MVLVMVSAYYSFGKPTSGVVGLSVLTRSMCVVRLRWVVELASRGYGVIMGGSAGPEGRSIILVRIVLF